MKEGGISVEESYYKKQEPFFGTWQIKEFIGRGSYGQVFLIEKEDVSGSYLAAMKVISVPEEQGQTNSEMTFGMTEENLSEYYKDIVNSIVSEFKIMEKFKWCANVVSYDDHEIRKHPDGIGCDIYIRMELLKPVTAHFNGRDYEEKEVVKLGIDICRALELCHKNNIIHRDVKPANIFISKNGDFKLGDFGVARTFEKTVGDFSVKGTFDYMAPEVQLRKPYGPSADIYSLGTVLYKMMNHGRIPFLPPYPEKLRAGDYDIALQKRLTGEEIPAPAAASRAFAAVIKKACESDPEKRYKDVSEMLCDLNAVYTGAPLAMQEHRDYKIDDVGTLVVNLEKPEEKTDKINSEKVEKAEKDEDEKRRINPFPILIILLLLIFFSAVGFVFAVQNDGIRQRLPFDVEWLVFPEKEIAEEIKEDKTEWIFEDFEEKYPFYAVNRKYINGKATDELETDISKTKYTADEAKLYYIPESETESAKRVLYLNGEMSDYFEEAEEMAETEWVIEGYDAECREYARLYNNGEKTEDIVLTGKVFEHEYFVDAEKMQKILYVEGKPILSEQIEILSDDEWVLEGYEAETLREYARRYVLNSPTEETKYTGRVFDIEEFYKLDENGMPYVVNYVNGAPLANQEREYIEGLGYVEEAWVIADDYEAGTYREYAVLHNYGVKDITKTKYTGVVKEIIEWRVESYLKNYPYYLYDRKYINGNRTSETRTHYPIKQDPSKVGSSQATSKKDYLNPDGSINYSKLRLEYWYDSDRREYKVWYDSEGNEVTRFATGAYKVERN